MNGGSRCPLFLSPSLFLTNSQPGSQASRLSEGEQSDWVMSQTPVVWSHGLMLCQTPQPLAHSTRFLSQQRNVLPTWAFYTFPVFFFTPSPVSCLFHSFPSAGSSFSPICPSLFTLFLFHTLAGCFVLRYLNVTEVKDARLQSPLSSSLPLFSWVFDDWEGGFPAVCSIAGTHVYTRYGEPVFKKKAKCGCRQLCRASSFICQNTEGSVIQTHTYLENVINWHCFADLQYIFVCCWHPLLHTALTSLIYTESNPLRCVFETTIFLFYE